MAGCLGDGGRRTARRLRGGGGGRLVGGGGGGGCIDGGSGGEVSGGGGEVFDHVRAATYKRGVKGLVEDEASVGGVLTGTAGEVLGGVGDGEDGVEPVAGGGRADAAVGGPDDGEEGRRARGKLQSVCVCILPFYVLSVTNKLIHAQI